MSRQSKLGKRRRPEITVTDDRLLAGDTRVRADIVIGLDDPARQDVAAGKKRPRLEQADLDRDIASIKTKIGSSAFEAAYDSGRKMTLAEAVALALDTNAE